MIPVWLAPLLFLGQHREAPAEPTAEQKQVAALVAQIRRLAASEPLVYGVDTRLLAADALTQKYPKIAKDLLREAQQELGGDTLADEQDTTRVRVVKLMAPLDLGEAEEMIGSIRRERDEDYVAQAYDELVTFLGNNHRDGGPMIVKGLHAGGFRSQTAAKRLDDLAKLDPAGAASLFAEILGAFPVQAPGEKDVYFLLTLTSEMVALNRQLALESIDKALSAATSQKLQIKSAENDDEKEAARGKMLREIARLLGVIDPELLAKYKSERPELDPPPATAQPPKQEQEQKQEFDTPDLSELSYSDALSTARKIADPTVRVAALIDIYRRETVTVAQRASVASEALHAATLMPVTNNRLLAMAMISRDFARVNEPANAAYAAELLSETYSKACACEHASCESSGDRFDCLELVEDFAKYLDEFKITPESMNLENISLQARLLILKLYPVLGQKAPSLWLSSN